MLGSPDLDTVLQDQDLEMLTVSESLLMDLLNVTCFFPFIYTCIHLISTFGFSWAAVFKRLILYVLSEDWHSMPFHKEQSINLGTSKLEVLKARSFIAE